MVITAGSEGDFVSDLPELHHYTTLEGLEGILGTQTVWATHFSGLKDRTELSVFPEVFHGPLARRLMERLPDAKLPNPISYPLKDESGLPSIEVRNIARTLTAMFYNDLVPYAALGTSKYFPRVLNPFISCFCSHHEDSSYEQQNGLLSQWRGYTANGGYCIVFDTNGIIDLLKEEIAQFHFLHGFFSPVIYSDDITKIDSWCDHLFPVIGEHLGLNDPYAGNFLASPIMQFIAAISLFKHRAFKEEREIRICLTPVTEKDIETAPPGTYTGKSPRKKIYFRTAGNKKIDYVRLFEASKRPLPIRRIIIGPAEDQVVNWATARRLAAPEIDVVVSETPYVF